MFRQISTALTKMVMGCSTTTKLPLMSLMRIRIVSFLLMNTLRHVPVEVLAILLVTVTQCLVVLGRQVLDLGRHPLVMGMLCLVVLGRLMQDLGSLPLEMGMLCLVVMGSLMVHLDRHPL